MGWKIITAALYIFFGLLDNLAIAGLDVADENEMFISDILYKSIPPVMQEAWNVIKEAEQNGKLESKSFEKDVLWNDIILKRMRALHDKLVQIDSVVANHTPSRYFNKIVNLTELDALKSASDHISMSKEVPLVEFWKEGWVKLSSLFIQLHYKYDWIFKHLYKEGYPDAVDHDLLDDIITLLDINSHPELPLKNRLHYVWMKIAAADRGVGYQQYSQTLDEVAGYAKVITSGKNIENNMFVGLRILLKMHPEIVGPYKETRNKTDPCSKGMEYTGISGVNYHIPVYILLYILNGEMKYYLLRNFAEMQKCVRDRKCDWKMIEKLEKHLKVYYTFYFDEMVNAFKVNDDPIREAPPSAWRQRCDPKEFKEGDSFTRFYDFDTSFVAEERQLSLTQTCRDSCDMFDGAFSTIPCEEDQWNCLETDDDFDCWERQKNDLKCPAPARKICPNDGLLCMTTKILNAQVCVPSNRSQRFINWITTDGERLKVMGKGTDKPCDLPVEVYSSKQTVERSGITKFEPQQCEVCLCRCYEPIGNRTHRYLSIIPQMAATSNNRVVAGIRFIKINETIHISIAEANMTYSGEAKIETIKWKSPSPVNPRNLTQVFRLGRDSRIILLDDLIAPQGYAVTGVRLRPVFIPYDRMHVQELMFQLHVTKIKETGGLDLQDSGWIYNANDSRHRSEVYLENVDVPTRGVGHYKISSKSNEFIRVQSSSLKMDAGQTPVPFIDTQEVMVDGNGSMIRGIGMYLKHTETTGGFLAFRIITDVFHDLPPNDPKYDLWHQILMEDVRNGGPKKAVRTQPTIPPKIRLTTPPPTAMETQVLEVPRKKAPNLRDILTQGDHIPLTINFNATTDDPRRAEVYGENPWFDVGGRESI